MQVEKRLTGILLACLFIANSSFASEMPAVYKKTKPASFAKKLENKQEADKKYYKKHKKQYKKITKDVEIMRALEAMKGTKGQFSYNAIMGSNLSGHPMFVEFKNLAEFGQGYYNYDALGIMDRKQKLHIYINKKHKNAPKEALASLLSHEAMHQDKYNSINEETYAWTLEAAVWTEFLSKKPNLATHHCALVRRLNTLNTLYKKAKYSNKYIRKVVKSNPGYHNLPYISPGFNN